MEELELSAKDGIYIQVDGKFMNINVYFGQVVRVTTLACINCLVSLKGSLQIIPVISVESTTF